jgi:hypothetical protein
MHAFRTIAPDLSQTETVYEVKMFREGDGWVALCDALPVATEAPTVDQLMERVWSIAPEIAELNGLAVDTMRLRFVTETQPA